MKRITLALLLLFCATTFAQDGINYKALIKDNLGAVVASQTIDVKFTIIADTGPTDVYLETHTGATTDANGIVILTIGSVITPTLGVFADIDWGSDTHSLKVEIDTGAGLVDMGTTQFMTVPYALQATTALNGQASGTTAGDMQYWNGSAWESVDATPNEGAALQMIGGIPTWVGGTPPSTVPDAPTIGAATAGDTQASVSFTAPVSDGGSPITEYTATSNPGGFTGTLSQAGSGTILVLGLSNGTAYTFSVTATNAIGTSNSSATSNSVTPNIPAVIGDLRDGGVVFWVDPADPERGLVCAMSDYPTQPEWGCVDTDLPNVPNVSYNGGNPVGSGAEIGDGITNTNGILTDCPLAPAALAARSLGPEWFLPSIKELNEMYINKTTLEAVAGFSAFGFAYWSSTENDIGFAWTQSLDDGAQFNAEKYYWWYSVRAVRAF